MSFVLRLLPSPSRLLALCLALSAGTGQTFAGDDGASGAGAHVITFRNMFAAEAEMRPAVTGEPLPEPPLPMKGGCTFLGWYSGEYGEGEQWYKANGESVAAAYPLTGDVTLHAYWNTGSTPIVFSETITVGAGQTNVYRDITFKHTVDGAFLDVRRGGVVVMSGVTVKGDGKTVEDRLSAVRNAGLVICSNCTFTALAAPNGRGAAYADLPGGRAVFVNCSFVDNVAAEGGAVASEGGRASFLNCTFGGNRATLEGSQPGGGAVVAIDRAALAFGGCTLAENVADGSSAGAGVVAASSDLKLVDSILQGNGLTNELVGVRSLHGIDPKVEFQSAQCGSALVSETKSDSSFAFAASSGTVIGARRTETVAGVTRSYYAPRGAGRTSGSRLWAKEDLSDFAAGDAGPDGYAEVVRDILDELTVAGYLGSRRGNALQALIDATEAGGTLDVSAGTYDSVTIDKAITIRGASGAVIDAEGYGSCVTISGTRQVFLGGFEFRNGYASGGGVRAELVSGQTVVSNCTFVSCKAPLDGAADQGWGGGTLYVRDVQDCTFKGCSAINGGGVALADRVVGCLFTECVATNWGGGAWGTRGTTDRSTFESCSAAVGGGARGTGENASTSPVGTYRLCVFADNVADADGGGLADAEVVLESAFTNNVATGGGGACRVATLTGCAFDSNEAAAAGGGVLGATTASNCTFTANRANQGGGLLSTNKSVRVYQSVFERNVAQAEGAGGAGNVEAMGCVFRRNVTYAQSAPSVKSAGGMTGTAYASLFVRNEALFDGGALAGAGYSCTFVGNYAAGSRDGGTSVLAADSSCADSLFYENPLPTNGCDAASVVARKSYFYDADGENYHLNEASSEVGEKLVGSTTGATRAQAQKWRDPDGTRLVSEINGVLYFYLGCYAFLPENVAGVTVNGAEDAYADTRLKTSLREAIEHAQAKPATYAGTDGKVRILFEDGLFDSEGKVTLDLAASGLALTNFTRHALVIEAPDGKSVTISCNSRFRPFYVLPGNRLELRNVTIADAAGGPHKMGAFTTGTDGGAVLNGGELIAEGCAFRNCRAGNRGASLAFPDVPVGYGGALWTGGGATTVVTRCTFDGCRAARGGAVYNADGSFSTFLFSTFAGNRAVYGGTTLSGTGGAVCQDGSSSDTAFVNCTIAGNAAETLGGALYATGSSASSDPTVHFLNCLIVGNDGKSELDDLRSTGAVRMDHSLYGTFTGGADCLTSTASVGGKSPADVFAATTDDGRPVTESATASGVEHTVIRLRAGAETDGVYAWSDALGANIGRGESALYATAVLRGRLQLARRGTRLDADQLGATASESAGPKLGAVTLEGAATDPALPDPDEPDPLVVTSSNLLTSALAYAAKNPTAARDGVVTVTFDPSYAGSSYALDGAVSLTAFTDRTLRLVGSGVTLDCQNVCQAFLVGAGNRLDLRDLTVLNGWTTGTGGGLCAEAGSAVFASNVTFRACHVDKDADGVCDGGGVAILDESSHATFVDCSFEDCGAAGWGGAVYRETEDIRFLDCRFSGNSAEAYADVFFPMRVRVDHPDGREDYYPETKAALQGDLASGDVLVILNADAQDVADLGIPLPMGVEVRVETEATAGAAAQLLKAVESALSSAVETKAWYSVEATPTSVKTALNATAAPTLGTGATVDLTGAADEVTVMPANVKPGLRYGLGYSPSAGGEYTVDTWVEADAQGNLPTPLTAPKSGAAMFYRVIAK